MIIGHLPSAYLVFRFASPRHWPGRFLVGGVIGGVLPDIDMLWFFTIGARQVHHHDYITHRPFVYLLLLAVVLLVGLVRGKVWFFALGLALGGVLHVALDTVAGNIAWGWPVSDHAAPLVQVPPGEYSHWLLAFLNHWYFQVEIVISLVAIGVFFWGRRRTA